jgi:hypothetical protein
MSSISHSSKGFWIWKNHRHSTALTWKTLTERMVLWCQSLCYCAFGFDLGLDIRLFLLLTTCALVLRQDSWSFTYREILKEACSVFISYSMNAAISAWLVCVAGILSLRIFYCTHIPFVYCITEAPGHGYLVWCLSLHPHWTKLSICLLILEFRTRSQNWMIAH